MKKLLQLIVASTMLLLLNDSCKQTSSSNPALIGTWKLQTLHLKEFDDQVAQLSDQVKSLSDSLAAATDTGSQMRFQTELNQYQEYLSNMQERKDSSMKNTRWVFKSDSKFEDQEGANKNYKGYWEYNSTSKMLTRYLPADSLKVDVKSDTLTVTFDSLNHIIFVKSK